MASYCTLECLRNIIENLLAYSDLVKNNIDNNSLNKNFELKKGLKTKNIIKYQ